MQIAVLDTETTGLDSSRDQIIEIGIQLVRFDPATGDVAELMDSYTGLQQPQEALSATIREVTGITDEMLVGQAIDYTRVQEMLRQSRLVIAHHAAFDRGFIDRAVPALDGQIWGCSASQVDWRVKGFKAARLQYLCESLGITYQAHRAMSDVSALVQLLSHRDLLTGRSYMDELVRGAFTLSADLSIRGETFDHRDLLKGRGYRWRKSAQCWVRSLAAETPESAAELQWAQGQFPRSEIELKLVPLPERFKTAATRSE